MVNPELSSLVRRLPAASGADGSEAALPGRWEQALQELWQLATPGGSEERTWAERWQGEARFVIALVEAGIGGLDATLLDRALEQLRHGLEAGERWSAVVPAVESMLVPAVGPVARSFVIHCAGHAHIDMNWLWDWPETVRVSRDTFRTMDRLMAEYPDFRFSQSQASVYVAMQEYYPEIFSRIRERQRQGQWEVTASTWVENDENMASGASAVRQLLYAKRYFARELGLRPAEVPLVWQPDAFGHPFTLPGILRRAGIRYYYYCRGGHLGPRLRLFWWEGPDGSRLMAFHDSELWYNGPVRPVEAALAAVQLARETGVTDYLFVYGVGDHGGGPTRRDLETIRRVQEWPLFPRVQFSTVKAFFERVDAQLAGRQEAPAAGIPGLPAPRLPVYRGELNAVFAGCYTSQSRIKQLNRDGETLLTRAEAWQAVAGEAESVPGLLEQAWRKHLFNQFHDILPGSGVPATYQYALGLGQQVQAAAEAVENRALQYLFRHKLAYYSASQAETVARLKPRVSVAPDWVRPVAVANPLPWRRSDTVTLSIWDPPAGAEYAVLIDPEGHPVLTQRLHRREEWGHEVLRVAFPALEMPPLGLRAYAALLLTPAEWEQLIEQQGWRRRGAWHDYDPAIDPGDPPGGPGVQAWIDGNGVAHLENSWVAAEIEPGSGAIIHLIDKRTGQDLVPAGHRLGLLEVNLEAPHGMSAWKIGPFTARQPLTSGAGLRVEKNGPVEATVAAQHTFGNSRFELRIRLTAAARRLEYHLTADWRESGDQGRPAPTLQVAFPVSVSDSGRPEALYEIPFGAIRRPADGMEVPGQRFAGLGQLLLLNRGRYGFSARLEERGGDAGRVPAQIATLRMTLLRASHDPDPLPDQGRHEIEWAIVPITPEERDRTWAAKAAREATEYQYSLQGQALTAGELAIPASLDLDTGTRVGGADSTGANRAKEGEVSWIELHPADSVAWSVLKPREGVPDPDADAPGREATGPKRDWIIRLYEVEGKASKIRVRFGTALLAERGRPAVVQEVDLLEQSTGNEVLPAGEDGFDVEFRPFEIKTILLRWT
ncbi:MAG TPA: alpha-mannosidase [Firmicutes bacterium]|nr:alpha-mannosidase [Bacillota bacterium]